MAPMVALNEKYHHNGTAARSNRCQAGKSWESEKSVDIPISVPSEISVAIQHPPRSSAASLCKSVNPCGPIFCGYSYDPEGPGYYVRNRNYIPPLAAGCNAIRSATTISSWHHQNCRNDNGAGWLAGKCFLTDPSPSRRQPKPGEYYAADGN